MPENQIVTLCTVPDRESGERIGHALVEERLAACVNLVPNLTSIYRWQGAVQQASECLLLIKTTPARFAALAERLRSLHPYDVPEIIALPITQGDSTYLNWITENTTDE
ncbi:MAG TPA: divalent-cation tolerance protein CutA [Gammaproteobacteria bacterium]